MRATAILPYFGGKRRLAGELIAELGPHTTFWYLCGGGLGMLMVKPRCAEETVVDLHGQASNLAMVLASDRYEDLWGRLARTLLSEAIFADAKRRLLADDAPCPESSDDVTARDVERAYFYFMVSWMGMQGVAGTSRSNYQFAVRYTTMHGGGAMRFSGAVDSIPAWHARLRGVTFLNRDLFPLLERIEDARGVAIYVDPPYFLATRGAGGGSRYRHDFTAEDHERLAVGLRRFTRARVLVSYYDHPDLERLYERHGYTKRHLLGRGGVSMQNLRGARPVRTPEVLLINGPSRLAPGLFPAERA